MKNLDDGGRGREGETVTKPVGERLPRPPQERRNMTTPKKVRYTLTRGKDGRREYINVNAWMGRGKSLRKTVVCRIFPNAEEILILSFGLFETPNKKITTIITSSPSITKIVNLLS